MMTRKASRRPIVLTDTMIWAVQPVHKIEERSEWWGGRMRRERREDYCRSELRAAETGPGTRKAKPVGPRNDCARLNGR